MTAVPAPDWGDHLPSARRLWPGRSRSWTRRPGRGPALLVLPSSRRPRMLVPSGVPGAAVMLNRQSRGLVQSVGQRLLAAGLRHNLLGLLPMARLRPVGRGADSIDGLVSEQIPAAASVGVLLGPPRANAKPVLQVFDRSGHTVAFGKVGHDATSRDLVTHEARVLETLGQSTLAGVDVPHLLYFGTWNDLEVLLLSPLSSAQTHSSSWQVPAAEMADIAESAEQAWALVAESPYWRDLEHRLTQLPARPGPARHDLLELAARVRAAYGATELGFGRWHGDFAPWNMGRAHGRLQLWDWEQSRDSVPLGFDAVHFLVQREFRFGGAKGPSMTSVTSESQSLLTRWYSSTAQVEATISLYLLEILHRYLSLGGAEPPTALEVRTRQLFGAAADLRGLAAPAEHPRGSLAELAAAATRPTRVRWLG